MSIEKFNPKIVGETIPYTQVNNKVVQTMTYSEAFHVWVYLLSLPADWVVVKEHLKKHFGFGQQKIKKIFAHLHMCNLVQYTRARTADGRLHKTEIMVLNGSKFKNIEEKKVVHTTGTEIHPVVNHTYGKQHTTNKTYIQIKQKEQTKHSCASDDARPVDNFFNNFWNLYPRKENKKRAEQIWKKKGLDTHIELITYDIRNRLTKCAQWKSKEFIPHPSTYLSGERWNDEIVQETPKDKFGKPEVRRPQPEDWTAKRLREEAEESERRVREEKQRLSSHYERSASQPKGIGAYAAGIMDRGRSETGH